MTLREILSLVAGVSILCAVANGAPGEYRARTYSPAIQDATRDLVSAFSNRSDKVGQTHRSNRGGALEAPEFNMESGIQAAAILDVASKNAADEGLCVILPSSNRLP